MASPHPQNRSRPIGFLAAIAAIAGALAGAVAGTALAIGQELPQLVTPNGIACLSDGSLLISDIQTHRILKWHAKEGLSFWGGTGKPGFSGDGGAVSQASLNAPNDLKVDAANKTLWIADSNNHRIRKVDLQSMVITCVAGNGKAELLGDGGPALQASLNNPQGIAVDRAGNLLIADSYNHVVRRVDREGTISTVVGTTGGLSGDGGPATAAQLSLPMAVAFEGDSQAFYVSDAGNNRIRRISRDGTIQTVCGIGKGSDDAGAGYSGDGDRAVNAKIFSPLDLAVASANLFYLSDSGNHRIRAVLHGTVVSLVGSGHPGGQRAAAEQDSSEPNVSLYVPAKIALAPDGGLFICDRGNRAIRLLSRDGKIETLPVPAASTTANSSEAPR